MIFGLLSFLFSLIGIFLDGTYQDSPLDSAYFWHVLGHLAWGFVVGLACFKIRYGVLCAIFALFLDFDHWLYFFNIELVGRMGHSFVFGIFAFLLMPLFSGKRDIVIGSLGMAAVLSHISFDAFRGSGYFPLFVPFSDDLVYLREYDWLFFQIVAFALVLFTSFISKKLSKNTLSV